MKLIDKDALIAEIKRRINEINLDSIEDWRYRLQREHDIEVMKNILSLIDTLEVKEVDLEKHLKEDIEDVFFDLNGVAVKGATHYLTVEDIKDIAKHFYELGIKAQKGE